MSQEEVPANSTGEGIAVDLQWATPLPELPLERVKAQRRRCETLAQLLAEAEAELREELVSARRSGELVVDLQEASGLNPNKVNAALREGGIPADRSAPRKKRNTL